MTSERPVCAIVGAGKGLGRALAAKFAREGFDLALISRNEANGAAGQAAVTEAAPEATSQFFQADVTQPETVETALAEVAAEFGAIEVLIYNARGNFTRCAPLEMTYDALEEIYGIEVIGAFAAAKSVMPAMIERGRGSVFFSSATAAFRGSATYPLYAIGKFGLRALSQSLAKAYAKDGVHIAHVRIDCDLDVPLMRELYGNGRDQTGLTPPVDVAEAFWLTHLQPKSAWSNEVEIRPFTETWTY